MTTTLQDAIRRVRSVFDESTSNFVTDTEITDWINDGQRDMSRRAEDLIVYDTTTAVSAGVAKYTLPSDVIRLHRVEFVPTGSTQTYTVRASTAQELDSVWGINQAIQSSYPSYYVTLGFPGGAASSVSTFKIQLFPVPSSAGVLNLFYYRLPYRFLDPVTNPGELAKNLDIVDGWDDLLILYAESNALRKDRDERWKEVMQVYENKIDYLLDVTRRYHDQQAFMTSATRTMVPQWLYESEW